VGVQLAAERLDELRERGLVAGAGGLEQGRHLGQ
jgi:hypothetical protein